MIRAEETITLLPGAGARKHSTLEIREFLNMIDMRGFGPNVIVEVLGDGCLKAYREPVRIVPKDPATCPTCGAEARTIGQITKYGGYPYACGGHPETSEGAGTTDGA